MHHLRIAGSANSHGMTATIVDTMYGLVFELFFGFFEFLKMKNSKQNSDYFLQNGHFCWTNKCPKLQKCQKCYL
jgi:hypothetical protein